jgi:hypothetical protein
MRDAGIDCWIQTYTGRRFSLSAPSAFDVRVEDIAHALSHLCRFGGHTRQFYSVAQHSVLVSLHCDEADALWGLLHDAAEAYVVDVPRPLKKLLRQGHSASYYDYAESAVMDAIATHFDLPLGVPRSVKLADETLLATEARDLLGPLVDGWSHQEANGYLVFADRIIPMPPAEAEMAFLNRFARLKEQ